MSRIYIGVDRRPLPQAFRMSAEWCDEMAENEQPGRDRRARAYFTGKAEGLRLAADWLELMNEKVVTERCELAATLRQMADADSADLPSDELDHLRRAADLLDGSA